MSITSVKKPKVSSNERVVVAILGAQQSPRMRNYGTRLNIVMPDGKILLQHQLEHIMRAWAPTETFVTLGYDSQKIIEKRPANTRLLENLSWETTGESEELRLVLNCSEPERLYIICGDIFLGNYSLDLPKNESWTLSNRITDDYQIGVYSENNYVNSFSFSFPNKFLGIFHLMGNELYLFQKLLNRDLSKLALWELLEEYVKSGFKLKNIELNTNQIIKILSQKELGIIRNGRML